MLHGTGEAIPRHRVLDGTDLQIAYNVQGEDLVLRVIEQERRLVDFVLYPLAQRVRIVAGFHFVEHFERDY